MGQRERLNEYIERVRDQPFQWCKHDCLTFTNAAFKAMHGVGWADDWIGRYTSKMKRKELRKTFGYSTLEQGIDARLKRTNPTAPSLGALITTTHSRRWLIGAAMGICNGRRGVFLCDTGLVFLPIEAIRAAWILNEI